MLGHQHMFQCDHPGQCGLHYSRIEEYAAAHGQTARLMYQGKGLTAPRRLDSTEQAIFLLIGNDHVPIIRTLFQGNPYLEVVGAEQWSGKTILRTTTPR